MSRRIRKTPVPQDENPAAPGLSVVDLINVYSENSKGAVTRDRLQGWLADARTASPATKPIAPHVQALFRRLGPEGRTEIIVDYKACKSAQAISKERGISRNAILKLSRDSGAPVRSRRPPDDQRGCPRPRL